MIAQLLRPNVPIDGEVIQTITVVRLVVGIPGHSAPYAFSKTDLPDSAFQGYSYLLDYDTLCFGGTVRHEGERL